MSDVLKYRDRKHCFMLYPDNPEHKNAIDRLLSPEYRAVGILHDKDTWTVAEEADNAEHKAGTFKKPHWHIVAKFKNAVWNTAVAEELGIDVRFVEKARSFDAAALYLIHFNDPDKYQYDVDDCRGSLVPELKKLLVDETEDCRVLRVLELIDKQGFLTMSEFIRLVCNAGLYSDVRRAGFLMSKILEEHNALCRSCSVDPDTGEVL